MIPIQTMIDIITVIMAMVGSFFIAQGRVVKLEQTKADKEVVGEIKQQLAVISSKLDMILAGRVKIPYVGDGKTQE